jgi:5'-nucleotidase
MPGRLLSSDVTVAGLRQSPAFRIIHFNDVYNVQPDTREPVGGIARFQTILRKYRARQGEDSSLLTLFSGDALNPSLESIFTKGGQTLVS